MPYVVFYSNLTTLRLKRCHAFNILALVKQLVWYYSFACAVSLRWFASCLFCLLSTLLWIIELYICMKFLIEGITSEYETYFHYLLKCFKEIISFTIYVYFMKPMWHHRIKFSCLFIKGHLHGRRIAATRIFIACNRTKNATYLQKLPLFSHQT